MSSTTTTRDAGEDREALALAYWHGGLSVAAFSSRVRRLARLSGLTQDRVLADLTEDAAAIDAEMAMETERNG